MEFYARQFAKPDERIDLDALTSSMLSLGGMTISYDVHRPGWRWSTHVRPLVRTEWCRMRHVGVQLTGTMHYLLDDGREFDVGPMTLFETPPGHDAWVVGDDPVTTIGWAGVRGWLAPLESMGERVLATVVFTDIVDSTGAAIRLGDRAWADLVAAFEGRTREVIERFRGRVVKMTGDGVLAVFDGTARAIRAAVALRSSAADLGVQLRSAIHAGEIEIAGQDVRGIAVHEASRILGLAGADEILASAMTVQLAGDFGFATHDRGEHALRGIEGARQLYAIGNPVGDRP
jgi:class 3 adenylate cyclase